MNDLKVFLGPLLREDLDTLFKWINDRNLVVKSNKYNPIHELNHIEWFNSIVKNPNVRIFSIRLCGSNKIIGTCQLYSIDWVNRSAELQIRIGDYNYQGKGLGRQALLMLLRNGFKDLNLHRIYLRVFENNERAIRLYKSIGFKVEGTLRDADFLDGKYLDIIMMSILKNEFEIA